MSQIEFNVAESRNGLPIIEAVVDGKLLLLHSKYDPIKEAERLIDSYKEKIEAADHILFYGVGMGYHIKSFFERFPEKIASVYEPFEDIANLTLRYKSTTKFPLTQLEHYVVPTEEQVTIQTLSVFNADLNHKFEIIVLPSYGKWQDEKLKDFVETFKKLVDTKKGNIASAYVYSRRWTINALMNLPKTLEHPNFLVEKKVFFKDKPTILVSAGPSLSEEIENLRKIKNEGTAYIFAVGSAYKALIKENIYPDAICTYDPQNHNYTVFNELVENNINTIPMIYGTTVGFETLDYYKGPKLYFPVSQDKLTVHFHKDPQVIVYDATTVAIVTLQLLNLLEVSKVILVGQNFAFKKDKYYAEGIKRYDEKKKDASDNSANEKDLQLTFEVEDVHGGTVLTNDEFRRMKADMENYLSLMQIPVINTTNGGAAIKGTTFKPLNELMKEELTSKVVIEDWWKSNSEDASDVLNKAFLRKYRKAFENFEQQDEELLQFLQEFNQSLPKLNVNQMQRKLEKFDDLFQSYHQNVFNETTILPVAQLAFEKLVSENQLILAMNDIKKKAEKVIEVYTSFLQQCRKKYLDIAPIVSSYTLKTLSEMSDVKNYVATSGVFHYEGEWSKKYPPAKEKMPEDLSGEEQEIWEKQKKLEDKIDIPLPIYVETTEKGATLQFRFKGTSLMVYGLNLKNEVVRLNIQIDKKKQVVIIGPNKLATMYSYIRNNILNITNLKNKIHDVIIEVDSDNPHFLFEGVEIEHPGRGYHIHEVERIDDIDIGKKIRCHYKVKENTIGEFDGLGKEKANLLPIESNNQIEGDFYFNMVDKIGESKILIADRNIQYNINFKKLITELSKTKIFGSKKSLLRLIKVNNKNDEWINYIKNNKFNPHCDELVWNHERIAHNNLGTYSYILYDSDKCGVYSKYSDHSLNLYNQHINTEIESNVPSKIYGFRPILELNN